MDGQGLWILGHDSRRGGSRFGTRCKTGCICSRYHLRDQQRIGLWLPTRQHEIRPGWNGTTRSLFCHRGRSWQHLNRWSPYTFDYFWPCRRSHWFIQGNWRPCAWADRWWTLRLGWKGPLYLINRWRKRVCWKTSARNGYVARGTIALWSRKHVLGASHQSGLACTRTI